MKVQSKVFLLLTVIGAILLPACTGRKGKGADNLMKAYTIAQEAQDYHSASALLLQMVAADSAGNPWVYDSLAFYHYFHLVTPGVVRNTHTGIYYAQRGLELAPDNIFLTEIKARLELEEQKVTVAETTFRALWNKTKDHTYLWILAFMEAHHKRNPAGSDSMINAAIADPQSDAKTVRIDLLPDKIQEKVPSKAAFIYLKATIYILQNRVQEAMQALDEALKVDPDFYSAKLAKYQIQESAKRQQ